MKKTSKYTGFPALSGIMGIFLFLLLLFSCSAGKKDLTGFNAIPREFPPVESGWKQMAENDQYTFTINEATAAFVLTDKETGKQWFSNPPEPDPYASPVNRDYQNSQFRISYYNESSIKKTMNSYRHSVEAGQFEIIPMDDGVKVQYALGDIEDIELIPRAIRQDRFEAIMEKVSDDRYLSQMKRQYDLLDISKARTDDERNRLLKDFPQLKDYNLYRFSGVDNKAVLERIEAGFIQAGYTEEDLILDHQMNNIPAKESNREIFSLAIYYSLNDDGFSVRIPTEEIHYHPSFPLTDIRLLEFFGASFQDAHEGYIFVPDASGALIHLDNQKTWADFYYSKVYGLDPAIPLKEQGMKQSPVTLPVFGMKQDDQAFLAIIEEGDPFASVVADIAGRLHSYNFVGSEFSVLPYAPVTLESLQGNKFINTYQNEPFSGEIRLSYHFLQNEDADYSGMARVYADYLFGDRKDQHDASEEALFLDITMAIDKTRNFLGVPYNGVVPLTTFEEARTILEELDTIGLSQPIVNLIGWQKGGVLHQARFKQERQTGSRADMQALIEWARDHNTPLFFDGSVTRVLSTGALDGFKRNFHAVKLLDRSDAYLFPINEATNSPDKLMPPYFLVSPKRGNQLYERALKKIEDYHIPGFSFRYAGGYLHSDFFERDQVNRAESMNITQKHFSEVSERGIELLNYSGMAYSLPYSSILSDVVLSSNDYNICDASVPFLPMVLSGRVPFAGKAVNLDNQERENLLKHIETGAIPHFSLIYRDNSITVHTHHDNLFSVHYRNWLEEMKEWSSEVEALKRATGNSPIYRHDILTQEVVRVEYENGTVLIINYGETAYNYQNKTIAGRDYSIVQ